MIEAKAQSFSEVDFAIESWTGPQAVSNLLAQAAREILGEVDARNMLALGHAITFRTLVDGAVSEAIERVRPDGVIDRVYDVMPLVLMQLGEMLWQHSPVKTGRYRASHRLLADGEEIAEVTAGWSLPHLPAGINEFVFVPTVPYARPIEGGWSKQAPDGVYQVVAAMGAQSFSGFARISFDYRELSGVDESSVEQDARPTSPRDLRQPVIIVQPV